MPNSNSNITRQNVIRRAYRRIGLDSPSVSEQAVAADLLNDLVAELDPEGRWLWTISNTETALTLVAGTRSYGVATPPTGIAPYIQSLETAVLLRGTSRIPLRIIDKSEATTSFELETTSGEPYMVYLEVAPDPANQKLHFLPTPSVADSVYYTFQRMLYDFDAASDNPDLRRSMRQSLVKILANELAPEHGYAGTLRSELMAEAREARQRLRAHNAEKRDSTPVQAPYF